MSDRTTMSTENDPARLLDSGAWEGIQDAVRAFRQALERGKQPAIEDYLTAGTPHRVILLRELIHEELELHLKTGRPAGVADFIGRFPEIANDPDALQDLVRAEQSWRQRMASETARTVPPAACSVRIGRYELGEIVGQGACGVVRRALTPS